MPRVKAWNDMLFGLFLIGCGLFGQYLLAGLTVGTAMRMGPGYVPVHLCWISLALGAFTILRGFIRAGEAPGAWALRPLAAVASAILLFTFVERIGFIAAVAGTALIACLGDRETRWVQAVALAAFLAVFSSLVFVHSLGLPFPLLPTI